MHLLELYIVSNRPRDQFNKQKNAQQYKYAVHRVAQETAGETNLLHDRAVINISTKIVVIFNLFQQAIVTFL